MIWLGYAGLSGAIVLSIAMMAVVVGLSAEIVLGLVAYSAVGLFGFGATVHLCVWILRNGMSARRAQPAPPPRIEPAFLRTPVALAAAQPVPVRPKPKAKIAGLPGAVGALFPQQVAH